MLVDGHDEDGTAIARSAADAPEIDGTVTIRQGTKLAVGDLRAGGVTGATEHDLEARVAR